jgi:hypothetical protein
MGHIQPMGLAAGYGHVKSGQSPTGWIDLAWRSLKYRLTLPRHERLELRIKDEVGLDTV